jgi:LytR cell envelope-related transcriptional attenuator
MIQEIGAVAGFAAAAGLAVLSALYFSQAREVKRLREWAGRAPERSRPGATPLSGRSQAWYSRTDTRYAAAALVGVLVFGGAQLTGDNSRNAQQNNHNGSPNKPKRNGAPITPGNVTVAVLNGTTVPGLAARLRDQIADAGFKKGTINVFSDQQLAESVVQYASGHQAAAKAVSRIVAISQREPVTANSRALTGDATVVVIAGADKAP